MTHSRFPIIKMQFHFRGIKVRCNSETEIVFAQSIYYNESALK